LTLQLTQAPTDKKGKKRRYCLSFFGMAPAREKAPAIKEKTDGQRERESKELVPVNHVER